MHFLHSPAVHEFQRSAGRPVGDPLVRAEHVRTGGPAFALITGVEAQANLEWQVHLVVDQTVEGAQHPGVNVEGQGADLQNEGLVGRRKTGKREKEGLRTEKTPVPRSSAPKCRSSNSLAGQGLLRFQVSQRRPRHRERGGGHGTKGQRPFDRGLPRGWLRSDQTPAGLQKAAAVPWSLGPPGARSLAAEPRRFDCASSDCRGGR